MELTIGLDVGTSSVKCLAMNTEGEVVASGSQPLRLYTPQPGWVEQNPLEIWGAVTAACRKLTNSLSRQHKIAALSISSQGGTTIPLDGNSSPTHPAFSWMDERVETEAAEAEKALGADWIYQTTGWPLSKCLPINHIVWLRKNKPAEFASTNRFCFVNDYVLSRLCGEYAMDPSDAGITQLYNLANNQWDSRILEYSGIQSSQLSPILASGEIVGTLTQQASEQTGLPTGLAIVNGAHDQYCAALGAGATNPGKILLSGGTAWVILAVFFSSEKAFQTGMSVSRHALPGIFGGIRSMGGVGASIEWLSELFWPDMKDRTARYQLFNQDAMGSFPGSSGIIFHPLSGGHLESVQADQGNLTGLALHHSRGDIARALMEGIAYELRWMLDEMSVTAQTRSLVMMGGASRSPIWPQIIADITRLPIELTNLSESAGAGAAFLAGRGVGLLNGLMDEKTFNHDNQQIAPDSSLGDFYSRLYEKYLTLWNLKHQLEPVNVKREVQDDDKRKAH